VGLGEDSSDAEDDDGAVGRIALHADHELACSSDHPFDEEHGVLTFGARHERASSGADSFCPTQVQGDQPGLRLVGDARSDGLDDHRTVELQGDCHGLVLVACKAPLGDRDPVGGEQHLRVPLVQRAVSLRDGGGHDCSRLALDAR